MRNCLEQHPREFPQEHMREYFQGEANLIVQELDVLAAEKCRHEGGTQEGQAKRQEVIVKVPMIKPALKKDRQREWHSRK